MKITLAIASIAAAITLTSSAEAACSPAYGQCGGIGWKGPTCCEEGSKCVEQPNNKYYSQCLPGSNNNNGNNNGGKTSTKKPAKKTSTKKTSTKKHKKTTTKKHKKTSTKKTKKTSTKKATTTKVATTTKAATTTKKSPTTTTTVSKSTSTPVSGGSGKYSTIPGGSSGSGSTTRYWDCCKASCSWPGKASVSSPVDTCGKNGISILDDNAQSGCNGGGGYMCNNNQPWAINDNLAYGFAAASLAGSNEAGWCCGCYELTFTSGPVEGKKLVVQVTNTGGDLGANHFDLQIPGGGVGIFNGCQTQWNAPSEGWGARYGGISSASECSKLPSQLQDGCKWRFNWFKNADNPSMSFKQVTCPAELVSRTGCERK